MQPDPVARRRNADETRALLIDAGIRMMFEQGASAGVQHIRLQDVLRRVGLTSGAAYRLWADQNEYQRDLAVRMVGLRLSPPSAAASRAVDELLSGERPLDEVVLRASRSHLAGADQALSDPESRDSRLFLIVFALRAAAQTWPELQAASRERHEESVARFAEFYGRIMAVYGLRMRAPFTVGDFAEAMAALGEGFALRAIQGIPHPEFDLGNGNGNGNGNDERWPLFAVAARGLVEAFMTAEPDPV